MRRVRIIVEGISEQFDRAAGWLLLGVMALIVINVILRAAFSSPIKGTYEFVGFFTALAVGLSIAHCAVKNGHIAITFIVDEFPAKLRMAISFVLLSISTVFMGFTGSRLTNFALQTAARREVSITMGIPFYLFIFMIAFGFFLLAVVLGLKTIGLFSKEELN